MKDKAGPTDPNHPVGFIQTTPNESFNWYGLTKREWFAGQALAGIRSSPKDAAIRSVETADLIIKILNEERNG